MSCASLSGEIPASVATAAGLVKRLMKMFEGCLPGIRERLVHYRRDSRRTNRWNLIPDRLTVA
jgi:hypothetical protein